MLLKLAALSAIGYVGYRYFTRKNHANHAGHPAFAEGQVSGSHQDVRDAGPEAMRDPDQREWTPTDQQLDESFPASDPPGNY
jgi:hypothetical protein